MGMESPSPYGAAPHMGNVEALGSPAFRTEHEMLLYLRELDSKKGLHSIYNMACLSNHQKDAQEIADRVRAMGLDLEDVKTVQRIVTQNMSVARDIYVLQDVIDAMS